MTKQELDMCKTEIQKLRRELIIKSEELRSNERYLAYAISKLKDGILTFGQDFQIDRFEIKKCRDQESGSLVFYVSKIPN